MPGNNMQQPERTTGGYVVSGLRPRIFIRNDSSDIGRGVTLSGLLKRAASESYSEWVEYEGPLEHWHQLPCVAMRYLLKGDREDAIAVGKFLAEKPYPKDLTAYGAAFGGAALDWVRDALPEEMAKKAADKLVEGIDRSSAHIINMRTRVR